MQKIPDTTYHVRFYHFTECAYSVGKISQKQFNKLVEKLHNTAKDGDACPCVPDWIGLEVKGNYGFNTRFQCRSDFDGTNLYINNFNGRTKKSPCEYNPANRDFPLGACVDNFKSGKCKCPYMTSTFGAVILPELYGKVK